jgi:hypothetical protein
MKKLIVVALVAVVAFYSLRWIFSSPEKRACRRLASLCSMSSAETDKCVEDLGELRAQTSKQVAERAESCIADANSCAEGGGCLVGAGFSAMGDLFGQFARGLSGALR